MPDLRRHRGRHPQDAALFAAAAEPALAAAVGDLAWLLGRGYAGASALKLVGDRHGLRERQRLAVLRSTAPDEAVALRRARECRPGAARGEALWIDGYNVLITVESALAGGVLLLGRDGCLRDLASLHGTFKRVEETVPALEAIGRWLASREIGPCRFLFDRPVSNSGRLAALVRQVALRYGWAWTVDLEQDPDAVLRDASARVATADSAILDACSSWLNLARHVVGVEVPDADLLDLQAATTRRRVSPARPSRDRGNA